MNSYRVETFDNYDRPQDRHYVLAGEFDTPMKAIVRAKELIGASLEKLWHPGATAMQLYAEWANAGVGVRILGSSPIDFNAHDYARLRTVGPRSVRNADAAQAPECYFLGW